MSRVELAPGSGPETPAGGPGALSPIDRWGRPLTRWMFRTPIVAAVVSIGFGAFSANLALTRHPKVAVASFISALVGLAIILEPGIGVLGYHLLAYLRPQDTIWGLRGLKLTEIVAISTLAATALHFALRPNIRFLFRWQTVFILVLAGSLHASAHMNYFSSTQARWLEYYDKIFLIYFVTLALLDSEKWLLSLAWVIAVSIGYLGVWANEQYFVMGMATVHGPGKRGSAYFDENDFAMVLVMVVPFLWTLMFYHKHWMVRMALFGTAVLAGHGVMITFSRGGFLGLAACGIVLLLRMKNKMFALVVALVAIAGFVSVTGPRYISRMITIKNYEEDSSATGRLSSWQAGYAMIKANPIFGVGFKRYVDEFPKYSPDFAREAHNSWVQLGAECGVFAVGSHVMLALLTALSVFRVRRRLPRLPEDSRRLSEALAGAYEGALVGYLVTGFFLSMEDFEFFFLLVAMAQILDRVTRERVEALESGAGVYPAPAAAS